MRLAGHLWSHVRFEGSSSCGSWLEGVISRRRSATSPHRGTQGGCSAERGVVPESARSDVLVALVVERPRGTSSLKFERPFSRSMLFVPSMRLPSAVTSGSFCAIDS